VESVGHYIRQIPQLVPVSGTITVNSGERNYRSHLENVVLEIDENASDDNSDDQNGVID
jgi:hypothetical protein